MAIAADCKSAPVRVRWFESTYPHNLMTWKGFKLLIFKFSRVNSAYFLKLLSGNSSVGRAQPFQGWGREFEPRFPLIFELLLKEGNPECRLQRRSFSADVAQG